ncbi:hypothetical protein H310_14262, partial [Aphanomyces invadans]
MSTLSPEKKRLADGSSDLPSDADQLVLTSPPKKPSKVPDGVLKHEVIDLRDDDSDEEKPRTGVARNPLVQGAPYGRKIVEVPDPHPWEEDVKPPSAEDAFVLRTFREVSQSFAIIVHDVEYQQKAEALKFFQQYNEDRSHLLDGQEPRLVAIADALMAAATANEFRNQNEFLLGRESLQNSNCFLVELESSRRLMQRDAEVAVRDEVQASLDECQDQANRSVRIRQERVEALERQHPDDVRAPQAQTAQEQQSLLAKYTKREVLRAAENDELVKKKGLELKALRQEVMCYESLLKKAKSAKLEWRKLAEEIEQACPNCVRLEQDILVLQGQSVSEAEAYRQREVESSKSECHGLTKALAESQDVAKELEMELDVLSEATPSGSDLKAIWQIQEAKAQLSSAQAALEVERAALAEFVRTNRLEKGVLEAPKKLIREQEAKGEAGRRSQELSLAELRSELEKTQARQEVEKAGVERTPGLHQPSQPFPDKADSGPLIGSVRSAHDSPVGLLRDSRWALTPLPASPKKSSRIMYLAVRDGTEDTHDTLVYGVKIPTPPVSFAPPPRSNLAGVYELRGYPTPASQGHHG